MQYLSYNDLLLKLTTAVTKEQLWHKFKMYFFFYAPLFLE